MKTHNLKQGTPEWHEHRAKHFNASEAPAMMGCDPTVSRDDLLAQKKFALEREFSDYVKKYVIDKGHENEAAGRAIAENMIGKELYPTTMSEEFDNLPLSASVDGETLMGEIIFEHKSINNELRACDSAPDLPLRYRVQMEQQLAIADNAEKCLFIASANGDQSDMVWFWYERDNHLWDKIVKGWHRFRQDLAGFEIPEKIKQAQPDEVETLPALSISVAGQISASNVGTVQQAVTEFLDGINRDLQTDEDFATAEVVVKRCGEAEEQAKAAKKAAVDQMADVSAVFRAVDTIIEQFRSTRLELDKLVKEEKQRRKAELIQVGRDEVTGYINDANDELGGKYVTIETSFESAARNKRTLATLRSAINDHVAQCKIAVDDTAAMVRENLDFIRDLDPIYEHLFPDLDALVKMPAAQLSPVVENRIMKFEQDQAKREAETPAPADGAPDSPENGPEAMSDYSETEKSPEIAGDSPGGEVTTDADLVKAWAERIRVAAASKPHVLDAKLSAFIMTRFNRIMAAAGECETRVEDES